MKVTLVLFVVVAAVCLSLVDAKAGRMEARRSRLMERASARTKALPKSACASGDALYEAVCGTDGKGGNDTIKAGITRFKNFASSTPIAKAGAEFDKLKAAWAAVQKDVLAYFKKIATDEEYTKLSTDLGKRLLTTDSAAEPYSVFGIWDSDSSACGHTNDEGVLTFAGCDLGLVTAPGWTDAAMKTILIHEAFGHRLEPDFAEGLDSKDTSSTKLGIGAIARRLFGTRHSAIKAVFKKQTVEVFSDYLALDILTSVRPFTTDDAVQTAGAFCGGVSPGGGSYPLAKARVLYLLRHPQIYDKVCGTENGARGTDGTDFFTSAQQSILDQIKALGDNPMKNLKVIDKSHLKKDQLNKTRGTN